MDEKTQQIVAAELTAAALIASTKPDAPHYFRKSVLIRDPSKESAAWTIVDFYLEVLEELNRRVSEGGE